MRKHYFLPACVILGLLVSCGAPSEKNKNSKQINLTEEETPKTENSTTSSVRELDKKAFSEKLHGLWYDSEYINKIQETYSVLEASRVAKTVISCGFDKNALMGENPYAGGASSHEGGYMAQLTWDEEENYFRSSSENQNNLTSQPFKIVFISANQISLKSMDGETIQSFRKVEMPETINKILLAGTYKMENGTNITFTPKGKIEGHPQYADYSYEIVEDFFEVEMDAINVMSPERKTQVFHYEVVEDGFVLYEIIGGMDTGFSKGSFVNNFKSLDGRKRSFDKDERESHDFSVKTNYFDLPESSSSELREVLGDDDLKMLEVSSLKVMKEYLQNKVFGGRSPFGPGVESAYFWNVYNALPDFVAKKERHQGYYADQNEANFEEKLLAYSIYRIDRSPENIKGLFDYAKPFIKDIFPSVNYERSGIDRKVKGLINSYKMISEIENYSEKLLDAFNTVDTMTGTFIDVDGQKTFREFENSAYGFSVYELNEFVMKKLNPEIDRFHTIPVGLSFLMRRNHEGNMEEVYSILKEIDEMY